MAFFASKNDKDEAKEMLKSHDEWFNSLPKRKQDKIQFLIVVFACSVLGMTILSIVALFIWFIQKIG